MDLRGKRTTVVGLGIEGTALVRYLVAQEASVTVSDAKLSEALSDALTRIHGLPVRLSLGENRVEDCLEADVVFVSQGVPLDLPALLAARAHDIPLSSMTRLFMARCPAPIAGITGSAGKTTTTALVGQMFHAAGRPALVGGNIGVTLLDKLEDITARHWVVLEISHTQLELAGRSPNVAAITNISPSHADRYPDMEQYIALKERIYRFQQASDTLVLNWDDPVTRRMAPLAPGRAAYFSVAEEPPGDGAFLRSGQVTLRWDGHETALLPTTAIKLLGVHNVANVLAACAVAAAAGLPPEALRGAVQEFEGIEHRLEWVRSVDGADYYNDSIATSPERTVAGLRSFQRRIVLLAGGKDKRLPLASWVAEATQRCDGVVLFGEAGPLLEEALGSNWRGRAPLARVRTLAEAVAAARCIAAPGDVVLLSPGCASFDQYANFEERGQHFKRLVAALAGGLGKTAERGGDR